MDDFKDKTGNVRKRNTKAPSCHHFCSGKAISMTHSDTVFVALCIQDAMRVHQLVICGLYVFPFYLKTIQFSKKEISYWTWKLCFVLSINVVRNVSHSKGIERDVFETVCRSSSKMQIALYSCHWIFSRGFRKNTQISNFIKIRPAVAELVNSEAQT